MYPNPVPLGGTAAFEVRVPIDDVVLRYTLTLRPMGVPTTSLAQTAGNITDFKSFGPIVAKQIQAVVETPTPFNAGRVDFTLVVTNSSALVVASVDVDVEIEAFCAHAGERQGGTLRVRQLRPGAQIRIPLPLKDGPCPRFAGWTAKTKVSSVTIAE